MQVAIRKIGNSKGVIIPSSILDQLKISSHVQLTVEKGTLILKPVTTPRQGWFDDYIPEQDEDAFKGLIDLESEQEEWDW